METQEKYLNRIYGKKTKKTKKAKKAEKPIFGYSWEDIQAMQQGTYKKRLIK